MGRRRQNLGGYRLRGSVLKENEPDANRHLRRRRPIALGRDEGEARAS